MAALWPIVASVSALLCAGGSLALGGWILSRRAHRVPAGAGQAVALALTACWGLTAFAFGPETPATEAALSLNYLGWLAMLYRLFAYDERDKSVAPVRPVLFALIFVELSQLMLLAVAQGSGSAPSVHATGAEYSVTLRLLFCVAALVLTHNLYAGASSGARQALGWPAAALALQWLYDLNLSTVTYLGGDVPMELVSLRGVAICVVVGLLAVGALRQDRELRFGPSRSFTFQSFSLLVIGAYLAGMVLVSQGIAYAGGEMARLLQAAFLVVAAALALVVLPSPRLRGWLRVTLTKHLFQHRYDYRAEWLRFTGTIGRAGPASAPLTERIIQAVADITDSPFGLLLTPGEAGGLALEARWQWPDAEVPAEALDPAGARFFESQFIVDLDDLRNGRADGVPPVAAPQWLLDQPDAWAMVPLLHYERLVGLVVLARPPVPRRLDWEDFDLLRIVGRQLASYLAEQASQDALGEAQRFDEFNRRIAFVMHDIKNLASQLSLLARNAEKHAGNPEFRADMLLTLRNSAEKLQALLVRLGRYGTQGREALSAVPISEIATAIAARYKGQHDVVVINQAPCLALADPEGLEQALVHLVHNAVEASRDGAPVFLSLHGDHANATVEVIDSGCGMSPEFVRNKLFKPFHSSKQGGFGIGAFEARELVRGMGGRLEVESREGLGTRFTLRFPRIGRTHLMNTLQQGSVAA